MRSAASGCPVSAQILIAVTIVIIGIIVKVASWEFPVNLPEFKVFPRSNIVGCEPDTIVLTSVWTKLV